MLADPGGNELCVIEPGNNYLAGTGYLGEVTCDGTRDVGLFWRDALGWPLVWDRNEQTAVQSPLGGTKISWDSWGGPPIRTQERKEPAALRPGHRRPRQRGGTTGLARCDPSLPTGLTASKWPTQTATNSAFTRPESQVTDSSTRAGRASA